MKKYEDDRISFLYPEEFKLIRAKSKWGQYGLRKGKMLITIELRSDDTLDGIRTLIRSRPPDDIEDIAQIDYFESVTIGEKHGIGHVARAYDHSHKFWGKIYRYLFPTPKGGLYIEISDRIDFSVDIYRELLESIKVKETGPPNCSINVNDETNQTNEHG